jgi:hypothetical protein
MPVRLTTRQAGLRAAAVAALAGLALVQVAELPWTLAQSRPLGVLSGTLAAACLALGAALAAARDARAAAPWRAVAALGGAVVAGWVVTRAAAVPGLAAEAGHWTTAPGLAACGLGVAALACAAAGSGARPDAALARGVAVAAALALALAPALAAFVVALGPGPAGGERTFSGAHVHAHGAATATFRPGFGGHAGHYIYPNAKPPQLPSWGLALAVGLTAGFLSLAGGALRRRAADGRGERSAPVAGVPA